MPESAARRWFVRRLPSARSQSWTKEHEKTNRICGFSLFRSSCLSFSIPADPQDSHNASPTKNDSPGQSNWSPVSTPSRLVLLDVGTPSSRGGAQIPCVEVKEEQHQS